MCAFTKSSASVSTEEFITNFKKSTGRLPSQVELSRKLGLTPQTAIAALMAFLKEPQSIKHPRREVPDFLTVGLFIVAAITFILSVYFTGLWFSSMFSLWIAGAISISMVSYMVLSPQVANRVKGIVKLPLWSSFMIALVFSMGSTMAGQYNQLTRNVDVSAAAERATLEILKSEEAELLSAIQTDRGQQAFHQRTLEAMSQTAEDRMENGPFIRTERNKVNELGDEIAFKRDQLSRVRASILAELQMENVGVTVERASFYGWLASLLGLSIDQVEFLIAALPAIFIDIIAALSLNLALRQRSVSRI